MNQRTHNMLMAARSMLENSGPELTSASDALTIARKVLATQDVAELVLAALSIKLGKSSKQTETMTFHDLAGYVIGELKEADDEGRRTDRRTALDALNHARVRFKHHGDLLDAATTFPLVDQALRIIDLLCQRSVGFPLREIDAVVAVQHHLIAEHLRAADEHINAADFEPAFVEIARAAAVTFWDFDLSGITVGKAESEGALLLAGRGVDPASFLEMQRFLPMLYSPYDEEPKFNTREYGHEANWTEENARFCWQTALSLILRLQNAPRIPHARDFYDRFEDVITVTASSTKCFHYKGWWVNDGALPTASLEVQAGSIFTGRAFGFYEHRVHQGHEVTMPLEDAKWIRLESHNMREKGSLIGLGCGRIMVRRKRCECFLPRKCAD